jgi:hypothetical protein
VPVQIRLRPLIARVLAHAILAPDGERLRRLGRVNAAGAVLAERLHRACEVWEELWWDLGAIAIAEEADRIEPSMEGCGEGSIISGQGASMRTRRPTRSAARMSCCADSQAITPPTDQHPST